MKDTTLLEVEVDGRQNVSLHFLPIGQKVRGRFDSGRAVKHNPGAAGLLNSFPEPIPGQRIGINLATGEGYVLEPLYEPQHAETRRLVERLPARLPPERTTFPQAHVPTWCYWLKRAVEGGVAKVVEGKLPETIDGEPRKSFHSRPNPDPMERLAVALDRQTETFAKILAELTKKR